MYVYLLGAGASCEALPLVKDFPDRLDLCANQLATNINWLADSNSAQFISLREPHIILNDLVLKLRWLSQESKNHASIDTFAKKLFITREYEKLLHLKATLSCYLFFEQIIRPLDMRYDTFFASIVDLQQDKLVLPPNIKIITWNYDSQITKSFFPYWQQSTGLEEKLQVHPVSSQREQQLNLDEFFVMHLNGRADLFKTLDEKIGRNRNIYAIKNDFSEAAKETIKMYDSYITKPTSPNYPLWNFAWDSDLNQSRDFSFKAVTKATNLIVIGYSFPFFNRAVDKKLLSSMSGVSNVYVQIAPNEFPSVEARIKSIAPHFRRIHLVNDLKQFYIPHDM